MVSCVLAAGKEHAFPLCTWLWARHRKSYSAAILEAQMRRQSHEWLQEMGCGLAPSSYQRSPGC